MTLYEHETWTAIDGDDARVIVHLKGFEEDIDRLGRSIGVPIGHVTDLEGYRLNVSGTELHSLLGEAVDVWEAEVEEAAAVDRHERRIEEDHRPIRIGSVLV